MYVDISEEQAAKLALIMYHGSRKIVFPALCDMMINFVQKHGHYGIGAISSGNTEIVFKMEEKKDGNLSKTKSCVGSGMETS
jgi:hypothetical protein